jgi:tetratricopeptide (TPR) repeat protein
MNWGTIIMLARKLVSKAMQTGFLSFVAAGIVVASPAIAQKGKTVGDLLKGISKDAKRVDINKRRSSLPTFKKLQSTPTINVNRIKPPSSGKLYYQEGTDEAELEKITDEGINQLFKLTQRFKRSSKRGELWLRLAEQYVEKARLIEYRLQQNYDEQLKLYEQKKRRSRPKLSLTAAQKYNKKAVLLYEKFMEDFPKDDKIPQALFFLGYNYFELNQTTKGEGYYQQLTKRFPKSSYVDQSNFALGEFYFENEKWDKALVHYLKVARNSRSRLYSFAKYKAAWCQYKVGQLKEALRSLEGVIAAGRQAKRADSSGGVSRIRLASEALKDLIIFYAEVGSAEGARNYFRKVAGEKAVYNMLEKLAYYYTDTGAKKSARFIFKELIDWRPNSAKAYDYQYQIVTMYIAAGNNKVFKQELYSWIENYGPESVWSKANAEKPDLVRKATQLIETTLRNFILQQHQTAQNSKAAYSQKQALSGYELYFTTFKESPRLDEMHFFYAELLFDMQKWSRAAYHYLWVVNNSPKSQYYEKANLNSILALEKSLPSAEEIKKIVGKTTDPVPFDKTLRVFEKISQNYIKKYPNGENSVAIEYRLASIYYYYNQFDQALVHFERIVEKHPKTKFAEYSANLILDIYNIKKDYIGLEKAGRKILAIPQLASSPVGSQIRTILERASFTQAQQMEQSKDYLKAAASYEDFALKNPKSDLAMTSYFNAAISYEKGGNLFKALAMYEIISSRAKGSKNIALKKKAERITPSLYEKTGQYERAADAFERFANQNQKDKDAANFYFNAAVIRDGMKFYTAAIRNYDQYFRKSRAMERKEALFLIGRIWESRNNLRQATAWYEKYMNSNPINAAGVIEASYRLAKIYERRKRRKDSEDWYKKTVAIQRRLAAKTKSLGVSYAAEAKFKLVYKTYEELRRVKIPASPAAQKRAVDKKLGLINRLKEELKTVIKYDDGFQVVASLALIGQAYQHMSAAIFNAPLPKGLDKAGLQQYKTAIAGVAKPFQDQAVENYIAAIQKAEQLEAYNDWVKIARTELYNIDKEKYRRSDFEVFVTKVTDWMEN